MAREFPPGPRVTYIIGDVRDERRLTTAANGVDAIVHAAALKRVPVGERNGDEFQATNIGGENGSWVTVIFSGGAVCCRPPPFQSTRIRG